MKITRSSGRIKMRKVMLLACFICMVVSSCKKDLVSCPSDDHGGGNNKIVVHPGESIQAAVDKVKPGIVIVIMPGVYKETIEVSKPGVVIEGSCEGVIIENPGKAENGILVTDEGDGFKLRNVTVKGFLENGVKLEHVDHFLLSHVTATDNGEYGLFPVFCNGGTIEFCLASGHSDTGIYVGQSSDVVMTCNEVFANVNGLEIENSTRVSATSNKCYDNVSGISVILLPGLTLKTASNILVSNNNVHDNNHVNFAPPGEGFESFIPTGIGIFILGTDNTIVTDNLITGNNFVGVATVSTLVLGQLAGLPPSSFSDIEPNPDGDKIISNKLVNNGTKAPPGFPLPAVDLLWDGSGKNNCWSKNIFSTSFPNPLPSCH